MKTIPLIALFALPLSVISCDETKTTLREVKSDVATTGDVTFAKNTFESLARGDSAVASKIDWETLTTNDTNVGGAYLNLPSDTQRQEFINAFITQFSTAFRQSGTSVEQFTNWRVKFHDTLKTEVSVDSPTGIMTLIVTKRDGVERISAINVVQ